MVKRANSGETIGEHLEGRLEADITAALRRKPAHEARLAGVLRGLAPYSARLRDALVGAVTTLVKRGSFQRTLYSAACRSLTELEDQRVVSPLCAAFGGEEAGGLASLSAACFASDTALAEPLAKVATSRHPQLAFAAEVARIARRESDGAHLSSLAPKIKESHRIALCLEVLVPLLWWRPLPVAVSPALSVLRDAERHLGRWLVLAEIAVRAGDERPLLEAREKATLGPSSARAAWTLVAWALDQNATPPSVRPTVELVARLSDRPSADRDMTFLFRMAERGVVTARPMLENLAKGSALKDETAVRSALYLSRDHGRQDLVGRLVETTKATRREALRGLAAAALMDAGEQEAALNACGTLAASRHPSTVAWAALVRARGDGKPLSGELVSEARFRRVQLGWVE